MPTIKQLPAATSVNATDVLPISQGGTTKALAIGDLLSSTQPALLLAPGKLLGRVSAVGGGPEPVTVGVGLAVDASTVRATGLDHLSLPVAAALTATDEVVVNSAGAPRRVAASALRGLFSAGAGVSIADGVISAGGGGSYTLPAATTAMLGGVRVDGSSIVINGSGVISATASSSVAVPAGGGLLGTSGTAGVTQPATTAQFEALMTAWLQSKATTPAAVPGWWNNAGIPTYS